MLTHLQTAMSCAQTFPLKYRRKSSPPPSPRMPFSPLPKWLDSDDDLDHEPALTSDDALTVFSSSCSRAPSLAPLDAEDPHVDIVSSPVREIFFRAPSSRAPLPAYNKSYSPDTKSSATREDVAAALLVLHSQPRLGPSRPVLPRPPPQIEVAQPPPGRPRVITPSLRNLVSPRTPSPPPRPSLLLTPSSVIDRHRGHATAPAQRTPTRHATPASSPLPPSSPFAEEADCDVSQPIAFYSVPCSKPKSEPFQARTDELEADNRSQAWSRDDEPKEECDEVPRAPPSLEASLVTVTAPNERYIVQKRDPSAPPPESSAALSPKVVDECEILLPSSDGPNDASQPHGSRPESMASAAPSPPASAKLSAPPESPSHDVADQDQLAVLPSYSRAASSTLTALDDERISAPSSLQCDSFLAASPLSSPPSSPSPDQRREAPSSSSFMTDAGTKRRATTPLMEPHPDVASISISAPSGEHACARTKRRRKDMDSEDDKPRRNRKTLSRASAPAQSSPTLVPTHLPIPAFPSHASTSTSSTPSTATAASSSSSSTTDRNPHDADANDAKNPDENHDNDNDDEEMENQLCPHPALLGILIEALALSRASSLPLSTLTRTNPALVEYSHAVLTSTLTWAVRSRILGCVRSSGEAVPPSYFYDPATDPDRERGDLLRCLMPRAGKRRETMKYKQYYWAPVVVGRGRTRTWDVDWEE